MEIKISTIYTFLNYTYEFFKIQTVSFTYVINSIILKIYHDLPRFDVKRKFPILVVDIAQIMMS